ncbi:T9SS type A sorting domain-containing protein [Fibrella arboris]|uniref:T9SS type A sorting domain-containing protein n=1 Tax=Fibrella arboris TaxID=3242486 RepID=UPI003520E487
MRSVYCLLALLMSSSAAFATHIIGGYIRAARINTISATYEITVTIYQQPAAGGDEGFTNSNTVTLCLGDGTSISLPRLSPVTLADGGKIVVALYRTTYTFAGPGVYQLVASAINRTASIRNIDSGLPTDQPFTLRTTIQAFSAFKKSPLLPFPTTGLQAALNQRFSMLLTAAEAGGDSLSYAIAVPLTSAIPLSTTPDLCNSLSAVATYQFPNRVKQVGTFRVNAKTGLLTWDVPTEVGVYSVAVVVSEWQYGQLISETQQELTLTVIDKGGTPVIPPAYEPAYAGLLTAIDGSPQNSLSLQVSPNPVAGDVVQAELVFDQPQRVRLELLDNQGRTYKTVHLDEPAQQHRYLFDLNGKPAGIYLIRAEAGGKQVVRKVLKQ